MSHISHTGGTCSHQSSLEADCSLVNQQLRSVSEAPADPFAQLSPAVVDKVKPTGRSNCTSRETSPKTSSIGLKTSKTRSSTRQSNSRKHRNNQGSDIDCPFTSSMSAYSPDHDRYGAESTIATNVGSLSSYTSVSNPSAPRRAVEANTPHTTDRDLDLQEPQERALDLAEIGSWTNQFDIDARFPPIPLEG